MNGAKAPETPSPTLQEKTVTPETLPTVIGADEGYDGLSQVTVNPDAQLKAENIRSGKTVFGVEGSFVGEPVYTNNIDYSTISGSYHNNFSFPLGFVSSPFSELGEGEELSITSRRPLEATYYTIIGHENGGIASYGTANYAAPFIGSSTYIPSGLWHHASATFNGVYDCVLERHSGRLVGSDITGNIKGTGWLCPVILLCPIDSTINPMYCQGYVDHIETGAIIPVEVDTEFISDSVGGHFSIEISAEIDLYCRAPSYPTFYHKAAGFAFIPNKIVIS